MPDCARAFNQTAGAVAQFAKKTETRQSNTPGITSDGSKLLNGVVIIPLL